MLGATQIFDVDYFQPVRCRYPIRRATDLLNIQ
jgi:hypothetical protein